MAWGGGHGRLPGVQRPSGQSWRGAEPWGGGRHYRRPRPALERGSQAGGGLCGPSSQTWGGESAGPSRLHLFAPPPRGEACDSPASQPVGPSPPGAVALLCGFFPLRCRPAIFDQIQTMWILRWQVLDVFVF